MRALALALAGFLAVSSTAAAQGNGHGNAFGHYKTTAAAASPSPPRDAQGAPIIGSGVRNFGSWLDDASIQGPGHGYVSIGMNVFRTSAYREVDLPSIDSGFSVNNRLQIGMSVPFYYAHAPGAPVARGLGDMYLNAKYQLRAPSADRAGFALIPMVEVLSAAPVSGGSRVQWAMPASFERQFANWRMMGSGGYFSRGALFGAGAVEFELSKRTWATGSWSQSYSTRRDDLSTALGLQRSRTDVSGGVTYALRSDVAIYGSLGRTLFMRDSNDSALSVSAGVSFGLKRPAP